MTPDEMETDTLRMLREKRGRLVRHPRRARKLRQRGEGIAWRACVQGWVWDWEHRVNQAPR